MPSFFVLYNIGSIHKWQNKQTRARDGAAGAASASIVLIRLCVLRGDIAA